MVQLSALTLLNLGTDDGHRLEQVLDRGVARQPERATLDDLLLRDGPLSLLNEKRVAGSSDDHWGFCPLGIVNAEKRPGVTLPRALKTDTRSSARSTGAGPSAGLRPGSGASKSIGSAMPGSIGAETKLGPTRAPGRPGSSNPYVCGGLGASVTSRPSASPLVNLCGEYIGSRDSLVPLPASRNISASNAS